MKLKLHRIIEGPEELLNAVIELPFEKFVQKFKGIAANPKIQALLDAGITDGKPRDEKLSYSEGTISADKLRPTQNIIGQKESLDNILTDKYNNVSNALQGSVSFPTPLIIYNQQYIIDGHHRWSQIFAANPKCKLPVLNIKGNLQPKELLKVIHMAVALDTKSVPLSTAKGINMLQASKDDIFQVVKDVTTEPVLDIYSKYNAISQAKIQNLQLYIWKNVRLMQTQNAPIPNAPDRSFMPQTDDADVISKIKSGEINYINPRSTDVKESLKLLNILGKK